MKNLIFIAMLVSTPASAASKVVVLQCVSLQLPSGFVNAFMIGCDKSTGVVATCPVINTSCAQAVAVFESAPDNLQLINGSGSNPPTTFWYTLSSNPSTAGSFGR
jgi:hypothetical protein